MFSKEAVSAKSNAFVKPLHAMRSDEFLRRAIAILVNPAMIGGTKRLAAAEESRAECDRFELELVTLAPPTEKNTAQWARDRVSALFAETFSDDVWHSAMPSGTPVVLIKQTAIEGRMDVQEALRRLHAKEITRALSEGEHVPSDVLDDYRSIIESFAAREVN